MTLLEVALHTENEIVNAILNLIWASGFLKQVIKLDVLAFFLGSLLKFLEDFHAFKFLIILAFVAVFTVTTFILSLLFLWLSLFLLLVFTSLSTFFGSTFTSIFAFLFGVATVAGTASAARWTTS
jgi:hypothetical protein